MATLKFGHDTYEVAHAVKGDNYIHGYDDNGALVVSFEGVHDFSPFSFDDVYMTPGNCIWEKCNAVKHAGSMLVDETGKPIPASSVRAGFIVDANTGAQTQQLWVGHSDDFFALDAAYREHLIPKFTNQYGVYDGLLPVSSHKLVEPGIYYVQCTPNIHESGVMPALDSFAGVVVFHPSSFTRVPFKANDPYKREYVTIASTMTGVTGYNANGDNTREVLFLRLDNDGTIQLYVCDPDGVYRDVEEYYGAGAFTTRVVCLMPLKV